MDTSLAHASSALFKSISNDLPIFKAHKQHPKKQSFFELEQLQKIFFPSFFCPNKHQTKQHLSLELTILIDHIYSSLSAYQDDDDELTNIIECLLQKLPDIREIIKTDLIATYAGDPAAPNLGLLIRCYPSISAMMIYRIANILYNNGDKCYCRELMETLHSHTGIDIHPGATIGSHLFIDHGVGVVIGETCIIGDWCRIYQQVTLGALHFQQDKSGICKKGIKRHPTIRNGVTIGAGAKVLGNIIIGSNVKIGANCWVCENIDDDVVVYISDHPTQTKKKAKPNNHDSDLILEKLLDSSCEEVDDEINTKISFTNENFSSKPFPYKLCSVSK